MEKTDLEMIICIVNAGFSGDVMDVARKAGATGGTIIHARGTARPEAEKLFNITISPEKDMLLLAVKSDVKDKILKAIYEKTGIDSRAGALAFSLPVVDSVGIK